MTDTEKTAAPSFQTTGEQLAGWMDAPLAPDGEASALLAAARAAKEVPVWMTAAAWERHGFLPYMATYLAACTPERIIALLTTLTARTAALAEAEARAVTLRSAVDRVLRERGRELDSVWTVVLTAALDNLRAALASASPEPTTEPTDA